MIFPTKSTDIPIPKITIAKWQKAMNVIARTISVPVALVMKADLPEIEVFTSSDSYGNPFRAGEKERLNGHYCEAVIKTKKKLLIPNALIDPEWDKNPDLKLGMISYLGFPLVWPDGKVFGTICVLDNKENEFGIDDENLILQFRELLEGHLELLFINHKIETLNANQRKIKEESIKGKNYLENVLKKQTMNLKKINSQLIIEIEERKQAEGLLDAINHAQAQYITNAPQNFLFDELLSKIITLTQSEYGFIGEIIFPVGGKPYLKTKSISNIAWNDETQELYERSKENGMVWENLETLFGVVITTQKLVVSNNPSGDPRSGGRPKGHPPLKSFLGLPIFYGRQLIGMVGMANRPKGYNEEVINYLQPFIGTCANIIQALRSEEELKKSHDQLLHAEKLSVVGRLIASIAHEINNPVFTILSVLEKTSKRVPMDKKSQYFNGLAIEECRRVANLIKKLQNFYRPSSDKMDFMDIHELINESTCMIDKELWLKRIRLEKKLATHLPKIIGVRDQIKQVILNIIQNAVDSMDKIGGNIRIETEVFNSNVNIYFHDDGVGIKSEDVKKIFDPFFSTKQDVKGTGLGLSVSYGIIKAHKGNISVRSNPGKGSTFTISLPVVGEYK